MAECSECGEDLNVRPAGKPGKDWLAVICGACGNVESVSLVREFEVEQR